MKRKIPVEYLVAMIVPLSACSLLLGGLPDGKGKDCTTTLTGLSLASATLSPEFDPDVMTYTADPVVISELFSAKPATVTATATTLCPDAYVTIADASAISGSPSPPIGLRSGPNKICVVIATPDRRRSTEYSVALTGHSSDYIKPSNTRESAYFGHSVALSGDTLAVGSRAESSKATGVNGNQDASQDGSGAVYVFGWTGADWSQQAYIKASNTSSGAQFGSSVALSGNTLVVGAPLESSDAVGVDGKKRNSEPVSSAGAVYVFTRTEAMWSQQAYVKASNTRHDAQFGYSIALTGDLLAVGSPGESSNATGVNGDDTNEFARGSGAVYVFRRMNGAAWRQQAYVKASNTRSDAQFGYSIALTGDMLAVGSPGESSNATGVNGDQTNGSALGSGAVYVFR